MNSDMWYRNFLSLRIKLQHITYAEHDPNCALGDVNNDHNVELTDAIAGPQITINMSPPFSTYVGADVKGDGKLGIAETLYSLYYAARLIPGQDIDNDWDGYTEQQGDCDDAASTTYPGAPEICGDSIDQDCSATYLSCPDIDPECSDAPQLIGMWKFITEYTHTPFDITELRDEDYQLHNRGEGHPQDSGAFESMGRGRKNSAAAYQAPNISYLYP